MLKRGFIVFIAAMIAVSSLIMVATAETSTALTQSDIKVYLNSRRLNFDVPPQIINGSTMVPLRVIFEAFGANVEWDDATSTVTATRDCDIIVLKIGDVNPTVNGVPKQINQPGILVDGRTLVPVRFISESFGCSVDWLEAARTVNIQSLLPLTDTESDIPPVEWCR
ncbi:MAG: copper amine oxidase N-terminal domain-containing protein [Firmicutes bacterium]|nr:copper amine oxidase N-terminal domain-containing protein [Bacillota bacterium]